MAPATAHIPLEALQAAVGPGTVFARLLAVVARQPAVTLPEAAAQVYGEALPRDAPMALRRAIRDGRPRLWRLGWALLTTHGRGATYRLVHVPVLA